MRIPTKIIVFTALFAVSTVSAQGWAAPPTRVCAIGSYQCPDHAQIHASWPARCPRCGAVLAAAPGGSAGGASGGAGTAGAGGRAGGSTMGSGQAQTQAPGATGQGQGGLRSGVRPFGGNRAFEEERQFGDRRGEDFGGTPEQRFPDRFENRQFDREFPNDELEEREFGNREFGERRFPNDPFGEGESGEEFGEPFPNEELGEGEFGDRDFPPPQSGARQFPRDEFGTRPFGNQEFRNEEFNNGTIVGRRP